MKQNCEMKLVLEDGHEFNGLACGSHAPVVGEIVFNTSMVGYQELISDPAYSGQIVVMTYPLMGQYGITDEDSESRVTGPAALVVRECCGTPSNFRYTKTLLEALDEHDVPCLSGVDTRMITRIIREYEGMRAAIVDAGMPACEAVALIRSTGASSGLVAGVSCRKRWFSRTPHHSHDVVVIDCGIKHSLVTELNKLGCNITVVPFDTPVQDILSFNPDGLVLSSGPGDPHELGNLVDLVNSLKGRMPIFGVSLGMNVICLSYGVPVTRLKCGFHGGRPVKDLAGGRIITAEYNCNYSSSVEDIAAAGLEVGFVDVPTGGAAGIAHAADRVLGSLFYPEGAPGPQESGLLETFVKKMEE